jgi:Bacterial SH3 domain
LNPARNRERKCSTCKHYQASPLWRKGWCRNPLLYDRNTNHLVEADSLACNRTFIDYWEPIDGPEPTLNPNGQRTKPRIAPSVPLEQVDRDGNRTVVTGSGHTPNGGAPGVPLRQVITLTPSPKRSPLADLIGDDDLLDDTPAATADPHATQQIEEVEGPAQLQRTAPQRAAQPSRRTQPRPRGYVAVWRRPLPIVRAPIWMAVALLALAAIAVGGFLLLRQGQKPKANTPIALASVTAAVPTPTGFGDPTFTAVQKPTSAPTVPPTPPPPGVLAPGAYATINSTGPLTVRAQPTTKGARLGSLASGTKVHIVGGPQSADGYNWWQIDQWDPKNPSSTGWCADFLKATTGP